MRFRLLLLLGQAAVLAACDSPPPRFMGAERAEVVLGGSRYAVYRRGGEAEAWRLSREAVPSRREAVLRGLLAIEAATGCAVRPGRWDGDQAVVRAGLDCGAIVPRAVELDCTVVSEWPIPAIGATVEEFECGVIRP